MTVVMRTALIVFSGSVGYILGFKVMGDKFWALSGLFSGAFIGVLALLFEENVRKTPLRVVLGGAIGLITSLVIANLVTYPLLNNLIENKGFGLFIYLILSVFLGYVGLSVGMKKGDEITYEFILKTFFHVSQNDGADKIIDTSVIIDGRIADVCETGFIENNLIIPRFVLQELQHIADSADPIRKTRGKRGLDILKRLQSLPSIQVRIIDKDYPDVHGVDSKLVSLAKELNCKIITNDSNLYKVAELQGVKVLNMNELASSLKPVVLPGEILRIDVLKEGKEEDQGVGYLEDGTMVVIDNARRYIGHTIEVSITGVLQTPGGRMIFSKPKELINSEPYKDRVGNI